MCPVLHVPLLNMTWPNEKIIDFINSIHVRPELWDVEDPKYRDRAAKTDGWEAVASDFGITSDEAVKKFRNLRTYAKSEQKRGKSGTGARKKKIWFAFEAMQFALQRDVPDAGLDTESTMREDIENEQNYDDDDEEERRESVENAEESSSIPSQSSSRKAKRTKHMGIVDSETLTAAKEVLTEAAQRKNQQKNPCSSFGEHVGVKLNSYAPQTRSQVEFAISKILYEADMKMFPSTTPSPSSSHSSQVFFPSSQPLLISSNFNDSFSAHDQQPPSLHILEPRQEPTLTQIVKDAHSCENE